jgi:endonuclease-8
MPEGDTLFRTAARLRPALAGTALVRFEAPRLPRRLWPAPGTVVTSVEAQGKHLLITFETGWVLHTHLRMTGSWHLYPTGARWRKPAHLVRALLETEGWTAVCFSAPVVRLVPPAGPGSGSPTAHLGPDLCRAETDPLDALPRVAALCDAATSVAEVLLDQRVAAGIGNVYKSEVLWACRVDPFAPISTIDDATRRALYVTAARLLRANLSSGARTTVDGGLAVYGRRGSPCRRCGTAVRMRRHGGQPRSTYWCPTCQVPTE